MDIARTVFVAQLLVGPMAIVAIPSCGPSSTASTAETTPHVVAKSKEEVGKYIMKIAGCHDCHTPGVFLGKDLKDVPESEWLTGSPLGFNGPWGTSYAANLRLKIDPYNESLFLAAMRKRDTRPPMPWASLHAMSDEDLGAVYAYLKSLGAAGTPMPEALPAGKQPPQPFIVIVPDPTAATPK